jgi:hypothetical protein
MGSPTRDATCRFRSVAADGFEPGTVGYEPLLNQDWSQGATHNAS